MRTQAVKTQAAKTQTVKAQAVKSPLAKLLLGVLGATLMAALLVLAQPPTAEAHHHNPCPSYSIQDVFDDPRGNWDGDQLDNANDLLNGLNPCERDTDDFCAGGGNPLCIYPVHTGTVSHYPPACIASINSYPTADYDGDGVTNEVERRNGANPCTHPCPNPRNIDLALNPNGSWDSDGISNAIEVNQGTNPCDGYVYNPCPYYRAYHVTSMPSHDWDGDGVTNLVEYQRGTSPCIHNPVVTVVTSVRLPHVPIKQPVIRLPHVQAPAAQPIVSCPHGYPYYHPGTGLCYANPIKFF